MEVKQLEKKGDFNLNWRMTADPKIHNHELDFSFLFEIGPEAHRCLVPHDAHNYYFQDNYKSKYLQFILSDRVPNCLMEAMERQHWFKFHIDTPFMVKHFGTHRVTINAGLFKRSYPMIAQKYGDDQELDLELEFRRPRVQFGITASGANDRDMSGSVTLKMGIKLAGDHNYLIYDEIDIYTEQDLSIESEVLIGAIEQIKVSKARLSDQERTAPIYDTLDITEEQYDDYWYWAEMAAKRWQTFFNDQVLAKGIPLPYWNLEFLSKFTFHPHALIVVMDVFYNNMDII